MDGDAVRVRLRVICLDPPTQYDGRVLALRLLRNDSLLLGDEADDGSIRFELVLTAAATPSSEFAAFYWQNAPETPPCSSLCLAWDALDGATWRRIGQMRVPLMSVPWEHAACAAASGGGALEARVLGRRTGGVPACASVPLEGEGWTPVHL